LRGASSTPATHSSTLCAAGCVQPAASAELCASHTTSLGGSISALSTPPDFSRSSISGVACVGGVDVQLCGACVRSGFFGVCSPAGFRFVCPFRLAVVVSLGWFGACVRSFSWRVFAVGWLLGFCVGCGWLFSRFSFCVLLLVWYAPPFFGVCRSAGARLVAFASLGFACVRAPGPVRVARLVLGWVGVLLPAAGFLSAVSLFFALWLRCVVVVVGFGYRRSRARVWDAGRLGCGTFSDASCLW
jgi:hypothetical protein